MLMHLPKATQVGGVTSDPTFLRAAVNPFLLQRSGAPATILEPGTKVVCHPETSGQACLIKSRKQQNATKRIKFHLTTKRTGRKDPEMLALQSSQTTEETDRDMALETPSTPTNACPRKHDGGKFQTSTRESSEVLDGARR